MSEYSSSEKISIFNARKLDTSKIWMLFLFFGWSYGSMGSMGKQILFYCTLGGASLWTIYRLFTLNGKMKEYNKKIAFEIGLNHKDIAMLGL